MILNRLYELAEREKLLEDPAFEMLPTPFVIHLQSDGAFLGVIDRRESIEVPSKKAGGQIKTRLGKGKELSVPKPHGNTANRGFARFFCDTLARVLPMTDDEKSANSRRTFWAQVRRAAEETGDPGLSAVSRFGEKLEHDPELAKRVGETIAVLKPGPGDRCTFAWHPDGGDTILEREPVRAWYRAFFQEVMGERAADAELGFCQLTGQFEPLATTHVTKLSGIPGGIASGTALVSYDKAAFESYGLDKATNAAIGMRAAEGYTRALNALLANKLPARPRTSFRVNNLVFLFWTREPVDGLDPNELFTPTPDQVERLLAAPLSRRKAADSTVDANDFYCLILSANSARAIVRGYLEQPVSRAQRHLAAWFRDLAIVDIYSLEVTRLFGLAQLAQMTAISDHVAPDVGTRLFWCAFSGEPLPLSILTSCLRRLIAEGVSAFQPARMALIKLFLARKDIPMTETLDPGDQHPAYLCGRLLALLEQIQRVALDDVNATVVDKFYGAFSTAPALVFPRLVANARNHLRKIRDKSRGAYVALERELAELLDRLESPPAQRFSLTDQARFALGFYHHKAAMYQGIADHKAAKALAAEAQLVAES